MRSTKPSLTKRLSSALSRKKTVEPQIVVNYVKLLDLKKQILYGILADIRQRSRSREDEVVTQYQYENTFEYRSGAKIPNSKSLKWLTGCFKQGGDCPVRANPEVHYDGDDEDEAFGGSLGKMNKRKSNRRRKSLSRKSLRKKSTRRKSNRKKSTRKKSIKKKSSRKKLSRRRR